MDGHMFDGLGKLLAFLAFFGLIGLMATGYAGVKLIMWLCEHVHIS